MSEDEEFTIFNESYAGRRPRSLDARVKWARGNAIAVQLLIKPILSHNNGSDSFLIEKVQ